MLSISAMNGGQAGYYGQMSNKEDYYLNGERNESAWMGAGAAKRDLAGQPIATDVFVNLFHGFSEDHSKKLVQNAGKTDPKEYHRHKPGWDLCFSAAKSVSIAWALANPETQAQIEAAQKAAVGEAISYLERHAAFTRRGQGKGYEKAGLCVATFQHGCSRMQDMQLHTHALVMNFGVREDGNTSSLVSKHFYNAKMAAGQVYRNRLAQELEKAGFELEWRETKRGTFFDIKGISKEQMQHFSKRRAQLEARMEQKGVEGAHEAEKAALFTRSVKSHLPSAELFRRWKEEAGAKGLTTEYIETLVRGRQPQQKEAMRKPISVLEYETPYSKRKETIPITPSPRHAMQSVPMERTFEASKEHTVSGVGSIFRQPNNKAHNQQNKPIDPQREQSERKLFDTIIKASEKSAYCTRTVTVTARKLYEAMHGKFTEEETAAFHHLTRSGGRVKSITHDLNVDSSRALAATKMAWKLQGFAVYGAALSNAGAKSLQKETGIESKALANRLYAIEKGYLTVSRKSVFVLEEAHRVESALLDRFVSQVQKRGGTVVLVGKEGGENSPFSRIAEAVGGVKLKTEQTPRPEWQQRAAANFAQGDRGKTFEEFSRQGALRVEKTQGEAHRVMVKDWASKGDPKKSLLIAEQTADVSRLNHAAQTERLYAKELGIASVKIGTDRFYKGDQIIITRSKAAYNVSANERGQISFVDPITRMMDVRMEDGRRVTLPTLVFKDISLGYAVTTRRLENMKTKVESAFVLVGSGPQDKDASMQQLNRATKETTLYTDEKTAGTKLAQRSRSREQSKATEASPQVERYRGLSLDLTRNL